MGGVFVRKVNNNGKYTENSRSKVTELIKDQIPQFLTNVQFGSASQKDSITISHGKKIKSGLIQRYNAGLVKNNDTVILQQGRVFSLKCNVTVSEQQLCT